MLSVSSLVPHLQTPYFGHLVTVILRIMGLNIPPSVRIGSGLELPHGAVGLVIHEDTVLGDNIKLYQGVTLGRSDTYKDAASTRPGGNIVIEDHVVVGANASILFRSGQTLTVGSGSVVGANSVVLTDVPPGEIWAGVPARFVRFRH